MKVIIMKNNKHRYILSTLFIAYTICLSFHMHSAQLTDLPGMVNAENIEHKSEQTSHVEFHAISVRDPQPQPQYAQAPTGHPEVERILRQPAAAYEQKKSAAHTVSEQHDLYSNAHGSKSFENRLDYNLEMQRFHSPKSYETSPPSSPLLPITKTNEYIRVYEQLLAAVTPIPELQKIIRDYAFPPEALLKQLYDLKQFSVYTADCCDQFLQQTEILETTENNQDHYLIATRHLPNQVYLHTIEGERPNQHFPYYHEDIRTFDKMPCEHFRKPLGLCFACYLTTSSYSSSLCCPALASWFVVADVVGSCSSTMMCGGYCRDLYNKTKSPASKKASLVGNDADALLLHPNNMIILGSHVDIVDDYYHSIAGYGKCCSREKVFTLEFWNHQGRLQRMIYTAHDDTITSIIVRTQHSIITASKDKTVKIWPLRAEDKDDAVVLYHPYPVKHIAVHDYGIATVTDHAITLWSLGGTKIHRINHRPCFISGTSICKDGTLIFALGKENAAPPHAPCDLIVHYNPNDPTTDKSIKEFTLPAHIYNVTVCKEQADKTIIIGTRTGHLFRWNVDNSITQLRQYNCPIVSITILKNGAIAVSTADNTIEFLMTDNAAEKLLSSCTLEQLALAQAVLHRSKQRPHEAIILSEDTHERELFYSLPTYIRGALRAHCPQLKTPASCFTCKTPTSCCCTCYET